MSSIVVAGDVSGSVTLSAPSAAGSAVLTLPTTSGTILTTTSPKAGNVIQVLQTVKSDTFSTTANNTFVDITGLSVSITPSSSSSKILIMVDVGYGITNSAYSLFCQLLRDSTAIYQGDASSSSNRGQVMFPGDISGSQYMIYRPNTVYLDSPGTTSSVTYKVQIKSGNGTIAYVNRTGADLGTSGGGVRTASSITVMEIAA